ncbi:MBL fold metallo-hydrolase [Chelativorans sp. AA-79]|uniref:MBL fold metallo-hydrolase n=1 Tax=Chelativorans sp. AA-79 TaxID=3028735 RepID=UPI0023F99538|nr:MBL fold metallo-hydrolase [Chelativorans sp. AA-79]WEX08100.1 MBL fold metallo-hydrolase [Chelativorans sp. AA-79]
MQDIRLGDVTISAILEHQKLGLTPEQLFLGSDAETARRHYAEMEPFLYDAETGRIVLAFQSFLIRTPKNIIMVDTCNGADKLKDKIVWDTRPWLDRFHQLGLTFADVDFVLCTHLHIDHTGWNTRLEQGRWVPTFPNATYLFQKREYVYWQRAAETGAKPPRHQDDIWQINCLPVAEAGQAELVEGAHEVDAYVSLLPTPGHSPGHYCVHIHSGGLEAIALGDLAHHMLQCREPGWSTPFCWDPEMAARSRMKLLSEAVQSRALLLPTHFPAPTAGRVTADGERFRYHFHEA